MNSRNIAYTLLFGFFSFSVSAQSDTANLYKNVLKINLPSLPYGSFHVQYEKAITEKTAIALAVRFKPKGEVPFKGLTKKILIDDAAAKGLENTTMANITFTPEIRFYSNKNLRGFYVAPFARVSNYSLDVPFSFEMRNPNDPGSYNEVMPMFGYLNTYTVGFYFGTQFNLSKRIALDWWMFGFQYGIVRGALTGNKVLSEQEHMNLSRALSKVKNLPTVKASYSLADNQADIKFNGFWPGIRVGLNLAYRF